MAKGYVTELNNGNQISLGKLKDKYYFTGINRDKSKRGKKTNIVFSEEAMDVILAMYLKINENKTNPTVAEP